MYIHYCNVYGVKQINKVQNAKNMQKREKREKTLASTQTTSQNMNHRLNGSSSPVLTATCLSYGRLCDFLGLFSRTDLEVTPLDRF